MVKKESEEIRDCISNSGFPLEINSSRVIEGFGWSVYNNVIYPNERTKKDSQIDIVAQKIKNKTPSVTLKKILLIECKKSSKKPWVFFKENKVTRDVFNLNIASRTQGVPYRIFERFIENHHYSKLPISNYYFVAFAKVDSKESDSIYHAVTQAIDSTLFYLIRDTNYLQTYSVKEVEAIYPIIVFDGNLFSAIVSGNEVKIEKEKHILLRVLKELDEAEKIVWDFEKGVSKLIKSKPFLIDIVHKDYLPEFLKIIDNDTP